MDHGFTNDYADKYYAIIRAKETKKAMLKTIIAIRHKTRLILNYATQRGPRSDTKFAINSIRQTKKYHPHYILADMSIRHRTHKKMYKRIHWSF